jgi:hypothetical protein
MTSPPERSFARLLKLRREKWSAARKICERRADGGGVGTPEDVSGRMAPSEAIKEDCVPVNG